MSTTSKNSRFPGPTVTGMLIFGLCSFLLSFVGKDYWVSAFTHPLRTVPGKELPDTTLTGIELLHTLFWVNGFCWVVSAAILFCWQRRHKERFDRTWTRTGSGVALVIGLISVAFLIRIPLMNQSLWYDEIVAFWYYGQYGPGPIVGNMFTPANHTLQSLSSWAMATFAGGSLDGWVLRFPSLCLGLLTAWPVFILARRATTPLGGCLAIGLILFAPIALLESTEARGYAYMLFFSASASALLLTALQDKRAALLPFYAIVCALGIWSHLVTVVIPIGHTLLLLWMLMQQGAHRRFLLMALGAVGLAAVTTLLFLAPVLPDLYTTRSSFEATTNDQPGLFGREGRAIVAGLGGSWSLSTSLIGSTLALLGVVCALRCKDAQKPLLITGLPLIVALGLIIGLGTWVYARFLVFNLTFMALAITVGIFALYRYARPLAFVATALLAVSWSLDIWYRWSVPRQPVRELISAIPDDGSLVASRGIQDMPIVLSWYLPQAQTRIVDAGPYQPTSEALLSNPDVGWIVLSYPRQVEGPNWRDQLVDELGFEIQAHYPGWIDDDGDLILLKRSSRDEVR